MENKDHLLSSTMGLQRTDNRIAAILSLLPPSHRLIDVGTDHGKVAIGAAARSDIDQVLATDISAGSLAKIRQARRSLPKELAEKILIQQTDGLHHLLWDSATTVVIAGMGGLTVLKILEEGRSFLEHVRFLILGPQSQLADVRTALLQRGACVEEFMVKEGGKFYPLFRIDQSRPLQAAYRQAEGNFYLLEYGPLLLQKRDPVLKSCLQERLKALYWILDRFDPPADIGALSAKQEKERQEQLSDLIQKAEGVVSSSKQGKQKTLQRYLHLQKEALWIEETLSHWEN